MVMVCASRVVWCVLTWVVLCTHPFYVVYAKLNNVMLMICVVWCVPDYVVWCVPDCLVWCVPSV